MIVSLHILLLLGLLLYSPSRANDGKELKGFGKGAQVAVCRTASDGMGAQYKERILAYVWACRRQATYVNNPMPVCKKHGVDAAYAKKIDDYFNLNANSVSCEPRSCTCKQNVKSFMKFSLNEEHDDCYNKLTDRYGLHLRNKTNHTAVHIRRGDRSPGFATNERYYSLLATLQGPIHIYSQGKREEFGVLNELDATWHLNEDMIDSHEALVRPSSHLSVHY